METRIHNVGITGSAGCGKGTLIKNLLHKKSGILAEQNIKTIAVHETASYLGDSGVHITTFDDQLEGQRQILNLQIMHEDFADELAQNFVGKFENILIVYDRTIIDNSIYQSKDNYIYLLQEHGLDEDSVMDRYPMIVFLSPAPEKEYSTANNDNRIETSYQEILDQDEMLLESYGNHNNIRRIDNNYPNFDLKGGKIEAARNSIVQYVKRTLHEK